MGGRDRSDDGDPDDDRQGGAGAAVTRSARNGVAWVREVVHDLRSMLVSYDVYRSLGAALPDERRERFVDGDHYLCLVEGDAVELIAYDPMASEFTGYRARHGSGSGPLSVDTRKGRTMTEGTLLERLADADLVDTVPVRLFAPDDGRSDGGP